jgi:hypothetical protein
MLYDYIEELDLNGSKNAGAFFTGDGAFVTPGGSFVGPAAIQAFYDKRNENVAKYQKDGKRTSLMVSWFTLMISRNIKICNLKCFLVLVKMMEYLGNVVVMQFVYALLISRPKKALEKLNV